MSKVSVFGLDLAKDVFDVAGLTTREKLVTKRRLRRKDLFAWFAKQERTIVAMETCPGSHYCARELAALGFEVRMIPASETAQYRQGRHKNDARDAIAIARAALSEQVRPVQVKSEEQLQVQALYRQRELLLKQRIAIGNQMRMQLLEFGVALKKNDAALLAGVREALEDPHLPQLFRDEVLARSYRHFQELAGQVAQLERVINREVRRDELGRVLLEEPGIGPMTAGYLIGVMGGHSCARNGRGFSAKIGLVPRQNSSGGKDKLGSITRVGDRTMRALFIQGARSLLSRAKDSALADWGREVARRRGYYKAVVAVANKLARHAWAIMYRHAQGGEVLA